MHESTQNDTFSPMKSIVFTTTNMLLNTCLELQCLLIKVESVGMICTVDDPCFVLVP